MSDPAALAPPLGEAVPNWRPPPAPAPVAHDGRWMRLEPFSPEDHADALFAAYAEDAAGVVWTYLPYGPFEDAGAFRAWAEAAMTGSDPLFFVIRPRGAALAPAAGALSYLRVTQAHGTIEIGHLNFAPRLQRTPAATEAVFTLIEHAFALGYRRVEWKCNALNAASRRAAVRYGFAFEGVFRQMMVVKGRNRDSAWYAILDRDWPAVAAAYRVWLAPENFDELGRQRAALSSLTAQAG